MPPRKKLPPMPAQEGPARHTRATTRSPAKQIQLPAQPPPTRMPSKPSQQSPPKPVVEEAQGNTASPLQRPFPAKRSYIVPPGLVGYSQARFDEELIEENEPGLIINGAFGLPADTEDEEDDVSPDEDLEPTTPHRRQITQGDFERAADSGSEELDETRSYDDDEATTGLALPMIEGGLDIEFFQDDDNGNSYLNISSPRRSTIAPTSPLVARTTRLKKQSTIAPRLPPITPEAEAAAIIATGEDILDRHQAKRRRVAPTLAKLVAAAERLDQAARTKQLAPSHQPAPSGPTVASHQNHAVPPAQRTTNARTTLTTMVNPVTGATRAIRAVAPAEPVNLVVAARQPDLPDEEDSFGDTTGRKRKRSSNPAPHHLLSKTPNTRIVLRRGKDEYAFRILVSNAYPDAQQRVVEARAAHDVALLTMQDAAAAATGASWSPAKLRLYGDTAWVRRSTIKAAASNSVFQSYRLFIPPALAERIPGGADPTNTRTYVRNRIEYLMERGRWLRGKHSGHTSMIYAHPTFATVLEQAVYRPASTMQRAALSPMPLPAIALVATAILCSLEEWSTGVRVKISFTEETYGRIYRNHLTRLQRMSQSHEELMGTLQEQLYEFCVARNEAQPVAQPQLEDELDDLDVLDSDMEDDGNATGQPAEFGDFDDFDE